jgi:hypothetical protein
VRVGIPKLGKEWKLFLAREVLGAIEIPVFVCGPFAARGAKGEENYP